MTCLCPQPDEDNGADRTSSGSAGAAAPRTGGAGGGGDLMSEMQKKLQLRKAKAENKEVSTSLLNVPQTMIN